MTTETIKLPTKVIDSDWKDDIDCEPYKDKKEPHGIGYELYKGEETYISPSKVPKETIKRIKNSPIKLSIDGLWSWKGKEDRKVAA